jgi:hypothetical protein
MRLLMLKKLRKYLPFYNLQFIKTHFYSALRNKEYCIIFLSLLKSVLFNVV